MKSRRHAITPTDTTPHPGYVRAKPGWGKIRLDPCDPNSPLVESFGMDLGVVADLDSHYRLNGIDQGAKR